MLKPPPSTFATFVEMEENRSALAAIRRLLEDVLARHAGRRHGPAVVFLHGPPGSGKSHLGSALLDGLLRAMPEASLRRQTAEAFAAPEDDEPARDLEIVEDVQHLPVQAADAASRWLDRLRLQETPLLATASAGPGHLELPPRLVDRLAGGLVVGIDPLSQAGRLALLQDRARRRRLAIPDDVLAWLAQVLPGNGRNVDGALARLDSLAALFNRSLTLDDVQPYFHVEAVPDRRSLDRIATIVGQHFGVSLPQLRSAARARRFVVPRQVSMFLARQLTDRSLDEIGAFFGGRDHSTVLHACRRIDAARERDVQLASTLRELTASLA